MEQEEFKRKLAAILSADVKDYTRLMREDETATIRRLTEYREVMSALVTQHHGRVVDTVGDNLLAEFASVVDAVRGAVAIQKEVKARNAQIPESRKMVFRIGINLGDLVVEGDRIYGDGVNIAARLEALAAPGGICISRTVYDQIEEKLPFGYEYLGEKSAKNIVTPLRVYKVLFDAVDEAPDVVKTYDVWRKERRKEAARIHEQQNSRSGERNKRSEEGTGSSEVMSGRRAGRRFRRYLFLYAGVVGFSFITNVLTWNGTIWFHWPALGWGFLHFLHWVKGSKHPSRTKPAA